MTSKIEWLKDPITGKPGYTINPVKGLCPWACAYCYARKMYKRFKWNPELRFVPTAFNNLPTKPAKVFMGSTMELFLPECESWLEKIFDIIKPYKWLTFIFLTKQPQNLIKFSPYPENVWLGVSVTSQVQLRPAIWGLSDAQCNKRFLSLEPLLENVFDQVLPAEWDDCIDWVIIGSRTQPVKHPPREWVDEIIQAADKAKIPLFVKEPMSSHYGINRKEYPTNKGER